MKSSISHCWTWLDIISLDITWYRLIWFDMPRFDLTNLKWNNELFKIVASLLSVVYVAYAGKYSSIRDLELFTFSASKSCLLRKSIIEMVRSHLKKKTHFENFKRSNFRNNQWYSKTWIALQSSSKSSGQASSLSITSDAHFIINQPECSHLLIRRSVIYHNSSAFCPMIWPKLSLPFPLILSWINSSLSLSSSSSSSSSF